MNAIEASGLCKRYGNKNVVDHLNIQVPEGAIYGLTARENMRLYGLAIGVQNLDKEIDRTLELIGLSDTGRKKVKQFSLGMKQRLGIAIAIALFGNPKLLILDEPINGLDPQGIIEFRETVLRLNRKLNMTILISSHILGKLSKISTHYGIIKDGAMIRQMSAMILSMLILAAPGTLTISSIPGVMNGVSMDNFMLAGSGLGLLYTLMC